MDTDYLSEPLSFHGMNEEERELGERIYDAIQHASNYSWRSMEARNFHVGISDLGYCSERTRRMLARMEPDDTDVLSAFIGTAVGDHTEQAVMDVWPGMVRQPEVEVTLVGDGHVYHVTGHPDLVEPHDGLVIDVKTARGLQIARRTGPSQQQQYQRHCYAKGAWESGLFEPSLALSDLRVANVWIDRAADEKELHVQIEPYSDDVVGEATMWLDDVVYAYTHNEEARKEPPRDVCARTCGFYETCRAMDTDVEGLITDDALVAAADMYDEGRALIREGKQLKDQAEAQLQGVAGSTGQFAVRWIHVNGGHVEFDRHSYERLDVRKLK